MGLGIGILRSTFRRLERIGDLDALTSYLEHFSLKRAKTTFRA